jgi:hypothetical protein
MVLHAKLAVRELRRPIDLDMATEEWKTDDVEKVLSEQKLLEDRKQALIADLLKQKEAAMKEFDDRLAKLGYHATGSAGTKRNHHRKAATSEEAKPKSKA